MHTYTIKFLSINGAVKTSYIIARSFKQARKILTQYKPASLVSVVRC